MRSIERRTLGFWGVLAIASSLGCGTIEPIAPAGAPVSDPTQLYMSLTLDHPAVNLSLAPAYGTVQLTATPRDALGEPMPGLPAPTFRLDGDTTKVRVTTEGLVQAFGTTNETRVIASLTVGLVTRADTALVRVVNLPTPPTAASLSIDPLPPDSAVRAIPVRLPTVGADVGIDGATRFFTGTPFFWRLTPQVQDVGGFPVSGLQMEYQALDPEIADLVPGGRRTGEAAPVRPGQARFVGRTMAYGVALVDTVVFTVTMPAGRSVVSYPIDGTPKLLPDDIRIAPFGLVVWGNYLSDSMDIVFDDPTNVMEPTAPVCERIAFFDFLMTDFGIPGSGPSCNGGGNLLLPPRGIPDLDLGDDGASRNYQTRQFPVPGVYPFHSVRTGLSGRVVVASELGN
jgi:hypothetical protein